MAFLLNCCANELFMEFCITSNIDLFNILIKNENVIHYLSLDIQTLIGQIIFNIALNEKFLMNFIQQPLYMKSILCIVFNLEIHFERKLEIFMLISYLCASDMEYNFIHLSNQMIENCKDIVFRYREKSLINNLEKDRIQDLKCFFENFRRLLVNFIRCRNNFGLCNLIQTSVLKALIEVTEKLSSFGSIMSEIIMIMTLYTISDDCLEYFSKQEIIYKVLLWVKLINKIKPNDGKII